MTHKNIFVYKHFFSLNISEFNLIFLKKLPPPSMVSHLFPSNLPLNLEILLSSPLPFLKIWQEFHSHLLIPCTSRKGGCTLCLRQIGNNNCIQFQRDIPLHIASYKFPVAYSVSHPTSLPMFINYAITKTSPAYPPTLILQCSNNILINFQQYFHHISLLSMV